MSDTVVEADGLTKRYGGTVVVDDVDLVVERGEVVGILGVNGAGKTTTVECVQGLRRPDAGSVRVCGLNPFTERRALTDRIGSQLQEAALPDRMKVDEALRLFAAPGGAPIEELLDSWGSASSAGPRSGPSPAVNSNVYSSRSPS